MPMLPPVQETDEISEAGTPPDLCWHHRPDLLPPLAECHFHQQEDNKQPSSMIETEFENDVVDIPNLHHDLNQSRFTDNVSPLPNRTFQRRNAAVNLSIMLRRHAAGVPLTTDEVYEPEFAEKSLLCVSRSNYLRAKVTQLITWKWFEYLSLLVIIINCAALAAENPCDSFCVTTRCQILVIIQLAIFAFFFIEMLLKMFAMGVFGKGSYLAEPWNRLDCFIVCVGILEYLFVEGGGNSNHLSDGSNSNSNSHDESGNINFSSIRAFRVLRPLRAITRIPSLRLLTLLLLDTMPMLGNVLLFCCFVFFVFGIAGVQLLAGTLRHRCFFAQQSSNVSSSLAPPEIMPVYYQPPDDDFVCSPSESGLLKCKDIVLYEKYNSMCNELFGVNTTESVLCHQWVGRYTECRPDGPNPNGNTLSFDNIAAAWMAIFQVISLEGWSRIMYDVQDGYSFHIWIYFITLVVIGAFFAVNLCLVVIATQFSETKRREMLKMKYEHLMRNERHCTENENSDFYTQVYDIVFDSLSFLVSPFGRLLCNCRKKSADSEPSQQSSFSFFHRVFVMIGSNRKFLRQWLDSNITTNVVVGAVLANAVVMSLEHHGQPDIVGKIIAFTDPMFSAFFAIEVICKMYAYGPRLYMRDCLNLLDLFTVTSSFVEMWQGVGSRFTALRTFRLLRVLKIFRFLPQLQRQISIMLRTIDNIATFFILLSFFIFIFALLGMSLFGCRFCPFLDDIEYYQHYNVSVNVTTVMDMALSTTPSPRQWLLGRENCDIKVIKLQNGTAIVPLAASVDSQDGVAWELSAEDKHLLAYFTCPRANFDSLLYSLFTVLQIFTQDAWSYILIDGIHYVSDWAGFYFIGLVTIGNFILFNLLVAILVEGFSEKALDKNKPKPRKRTTVFAEKTTSDANDSNTSLPPHWCEGLRRRKDYSLFLLSPDNSFRRRLLRVVGSTTFDNMILLLIMGNCIAIMYERPTIAPGSREQRVLHGVNMAFNAIFLLEAVVKIIAYGFVLGQKAYLKSGWNILDFSLVVFSTAYTCLDVLASKSSQTKILEIFRVFRLVRALRPLRVVNRSPGLKIVVETLLLSIKPIGNLIVICLLFFTIFSILGVQLFRGCFYSCQASKEDLASAKSNDTYSQTDTQLQLFAALFKVKTKQDCLNAGFEWSNERLNFDNVLHGLMTLFVFSTFDGWVDITRNGMDCVGVDMQPIRNYNVWNGLYFIAFLLIVCFFILNMFVGVVVSNFQEVQARVHADFIQRRRQAKLEKLLSRLQKQESNVKSARDKLLGKLRKGRQSTTERHSRDGEQLATTPDPDFVNASESGSGSDTGSLSFLEDYPYWRLVIYQIFTHAYFELFLVIITILNIFVMAIEHYKMPRQLQLAVKITSVAFTILMTLEVFAKMAAFGVWRYFRSRWNQLDVSIIVLSIAAIYLEGDSKSMPVNPNIIRVARIIRIARVFRLLKTAQGIRRLLDTVGRALPQVGNLALFFLLLFFIYASLGVELFGKINCKFAQCQGMSRHANFEHFGMALLTLFRVFTGDDWNDILKDMLRMSSSREECIAMMPPMWPDDTVETRELECAIAKYVAPLYFVSFVLIAQFVLINVVVAVLMDELESQYRRDATEKQKANDNDVKDDSNEIDELEQKVAAVENLVESTCNEAVEQLRQRLLAFSHKDVVSMVSTEYVLQNQVDTNDDDEEEQQRHDGDSDVTSSQPVMLCQRTDSMETVRVEDKAMRQFLFETAGYVVPKPTKPPLIHRSSSDLDQVLIGKIARKLGDELAGKGEDALRCYIDNRTKQQPVVVIAAAESGSGHLHESLSCYDFKGNCC